MDSPISTERKKISAFIIDEIMIQIGSKHCWLWIAIEPVHQQQYLESTYLSTEICWLYHLLESLVSKYDRHPVYSDGGTWYPEAYKVIGLKHHLPSPLDKSMIERVMQYFRQN